MAIMDPNETLSALRRFVAAEILDDGDYRVLDLVEALDKWLKGGGALPDDWVRERPEQIFEVRIHCDGDFVVVGRYFDYAKALAHVAVLKGRTREMALIGMSGADVVPAEVVP